MSSCMSGIAVCLRLVPWFSDARWCASDVRRQRQQAYRVRKPFSPAGGGASTANDIGTELLWAPWIC